ncbi:nucleoside triphosphate pyrophosphohydrolase [Bacillus phage Aurora]|uniref:dUTPase n=2 Tax=Claudivirus TaxID=2842609 RepID=A0A223LJB0_9CAUD|nr:nucleoside triphosphate pyrophosphohydrolase [Bacillus phage Aurora]YP_009910256.1 nucleoside triphosphate pyrophosphohydrolase [Bacillus phage Juan]ANT41117.1 dUTPase [Bacillus phage Aurora]ASU04092.1 dUTPase [Bacillus phage Juan]
MMEDMLKVQKKVDDDISHKIETSFKETLHLRKIAFKVELSELANEVGFFKYWKTSHKQNKERVLDEWADCLAFLNSIVISQGYEDYVISYYDKRLDVDIESTTFIRQDYLFRMMNKNDMDSIDDALSQYFYLYMFGKNLGFSIDEMNSAYNTKSMVNIVRAKEEY